MAGWVPVDNFASWIEGPAALSWRLEHGHNALLYGQSRCLENCRNRHFSAQGGCKTFRHSLIADFEWSECKRYGAKRLQYVVCPRHRSNRATISTCGE